MKCPECGGIGLTDLHTPNVGRCIKCNGSGEIEATNEEYIRQASTEELAEVLNKIFMTRSFCHICPEGDVCDLGYECKYHGGKTEDFVEWLKGKHDGRV